MPSDANAGETFRLLARARSIVGDYSFVAGPIEVLCSGGPAYCQRAETHLARLARALGDDDARFDDAIEAFVEMTVDVMRMQERYFRIGQFDARAEGVTAANLYDDEDLMGRRYLRGLYLAQVFWPNHLDKLRFFEDEFIPLLSDGARVLEVGTGPGTYGLAIGRSVECAELLLNDISRLSIDTAQRMVGADPVRCPENVRYSTADFLELDTTTIGPFDVVLFSEVVEHLREPTVGLEMLGGLLAPGAVVFFSTATNAAFYDHTIVFETVDEVRDLLEKHGFESSAERTILATPGPNGRDVVDYVAVLRSAAKQ